MERGRGREGNENENSRGDGNGDEDGNGDGNEDGIGEGGGEAKNRKKPHKNCRRDQALSFRARHDLCRQGWRLRTPDSSVQKTWYLYTRIAPRG